MVSCMSCSSLLSDGDWPLIMKVAILENVGGLLSNNGEKTKDPFEKGFCVSEVSFWRLLTPPFVRVKPTLIQAL